MGKLLNSEAKEKILALVPTTCPACGAKLELSEDLMHLRCTNKECTGYLYRRLEIMCKAFGIENIGIKTARSIVALLCLKEEKELWEAEPGDFIGVNRAKKAMAEKIYNSIHAVKEVPFANFLNGCCISRVGQGTSEELAKIYPTLEDFINTTPDELQKKLPKCGPNLAKIIHTSIKQRESIIRSLASKVTVTYTQQEQQSVISTDQPAIHAVVTGTLNYGSRPAFQKFITEKYGVKWQSAVSSTTNYLVTNDTRPTIKYRKAQELQRSGNPIQILSEDEFLHLLGEEDSLHSRLSTILAPADADLTGVVEL